MPTREIKVDAARRNQRPRRMNASLRISIASLMLAVANASAGGSVTTIEVDLDGDGAIDVATLAQGNGGVVVAVQMGGEGRRREWLEFAVGAKRQDAVCALPATLQVVPLDCTASGGVLEGCDASKGQSMLLLGGGECDAIRLFWNHDAAALTWWRS